MSVEEIRESYEEWTQRRKQKQKQGPEDGDHEQRGDGSSAGGGDRVASLDVMGVSALEGCVMMWLRIMGTLIEYRDTDRTGVRAAVDWLFIRVQNSRRR